MTTVLYNRGYLAAAEVLIKRTCRDRGWESDGSPTWWRKAIAAWILLILFWPFALAFLVMFAAHDPERLYLSGLCLVSILMAALWQAGLKMPKCAAAYQFLPVPPERAFDVEYDNWRVFMLSLGILSIEWIVAMRTRHLLSWIDCLGGFPWCVAQMILCLALAQALCMVGLRGRGAWYPLAMLFLGLAILALAAAAVGLGRDGHALLTPPQARCIDFTPAGQLDATWKLFRQGSHALIAVPIAASAFGWWLSRTMRENLRRRYILPRIGERDDRIRCDQDSATARSLGTGGSRVDIADMRSALEQARERLLYPRSPGIGWWPWCHLLLLSDRSRLVASWLSSRAQAWGEAWLLVAGLLLLLMCIGHAPPRWFVAVEGGMGITLMLAVVMLRHRLRMRVSNLVALAASFSALLYMARFAPHQRGICMLCGAALLPVLPVVGGSWPALNAGQRVHPLGLHPVRLDEILRIMLTSNLLRLLMAMPLLLASGLIVKLMPHHDLFKDDWQGVRVAWVVLTSMPFVIAMRSTINLPLADRTQHRWKRIGEAIVVLALLFSVLTLDFIVLCAGLHEVDGPSALDGFLCAAILPVLSCACLLWRRWLYLRGSLELASSQTAI